MLVLSVRIELIFQNDKFENLTSDFQILLMNNLKILLNVFGTLKTPCILRSKSLKEHTCTTVYFGNDIPWSPITKNIILIKDIW